ncbi:peptidase inhibitor family I36 protein [Leifsonia sp. WHRI 6310E]|uniref:peptidase inhibitor family I36 protein n=1 Tax=Leifsonia sp. WHRI 6310E TaxID=3162562 RepID=UPI0032EE0714
MKRILALASAAALAAELSVMTTAAASPSTGGDYCAVKIEELGSTSTPASPVCFETQKGADAYLAAVTSRSSLARAAMASVVLGTVYKDANYGGGSLSFYGSGSCAGVTFGFATLDTAWRNAISSARAYSGCFVSLYSAASYGGTQLMCAPNCATLGPLNDRVLSLVFRPAN